MLVGLFGWERRTIVQVAPALVDLVVWISHVLRLIEQGRCKMMLDVLDMIVRGRCIAHTRRVSHSLEKAITT